MPNAPFGLTDREREVLRLLTRGHDAKSAATALGLSVHTINEHLRHARVKTQAGSSRGAARLLAEREDPEFPVPSELGVREPPRGGDRRRQLHDGAAAGPRTSGRWSIPMLTSALVAAAIVAGSHLIATGPTSAAPRVVSTVPTADAVVAPGRTTLRVTFDRPMRRQSYSFVRDAPATFPNCGWTRPTQSADGHTFTVACRLQPQHRYTVWFNRPPYMHFTSDDGEPATPYELRFWTR